MLKTTNKKSISNRSLYTEEITDYLQDLRLQEQIEEFQVWWAFQSAYLRKHSILDLECNKWTLSKFLETTGSVKNSFIQLSENAFLFSKVPQKFLNPQSLLQNQGIFFTNEINKNLSSISWQPAFDDKINCFNNNAYYDPYVKAVPEQSDAYLTGLNAYPPTPALPAQNAYTTTPVFNVQSLFPGESTFRTQQPTFPPAQNGYTAHPSFKAEFQTIEEEWKYGGGSKRSQENYQNHNSSYKQKPDEKYKANYRDKDYNNNNTNSNKEHQYFPRKFKYNNSDRYRYNNYSKTRNVNERRMTKFYPNKNDQKSNNEPVPDKKLSEKSVPEIINTSCNITFPKLTEKD